MRTAKKTLLLVVCCALFAGTACPARAEQRTHVCRYCQQSAGRASAPAKKSGPSAVRHDAPDRLADILRIGLEVTPDFGQHSIAGTATIMFQPMAKPLRELKLDAVDLQIRAVLSERPIEDFTSAKNDLTILFREPIPVGTSAKVAIQYQAEPVWGLYFRTPRNGYPETDMQVWSQGGFDPEYTLLAKVKFKKPDAMMLTQLQGQDDLIGRLLAAEALGQRKTKAAVEALQAALTGDSFYGVRSAAAAALQAIGTDQAQLKSRQEGAQ